MFDSILRICEVIGTHLRQVLQSLQAVPKSSSSRSRIREAASILEDLEFVERRWKTIRATLAAAEQREVRGDQAAQLWLRELHHLAYHAADLLGLFEYEVVAQQVRDFEVQSRATAAGKRKRQEVQKGSSAAGEMKGDEDDQVHDSPCFSFPAVPSSSPFADPSFRRVIADGIRKFKKRFEEIHHHNEALELEEEPGVIWKVTDDYRQLTGSEPMDDVIFGREDDKRELIMSLFADNSYEHDPNDTDVQVPVIALVGMGGVGKTTLAQHVFNDPQVCKHYSRNGWVCVSEDFDVKRLTLSAMEALELKRPDDDFQELGTLQSRLKEQVTKDKFLLVLDDVWNENAQDWDMFYYPFKHGAKGSKILITTRNQSVANTLRTVEVITVGCLSMEDSWSLFQKCAFGTNHEIILLYPPTLVEKGKKITEKCKGLPLAIKVLGCQLYTEKDEEVWDLVLSSDLWDQYMLENEGRQVLGPLTLSYLHLPAHLKSCFVMCSIYPKDYQIDKKDLMDLWMAHDLLEDCKEDIGSIYIQNLMSRSFFQGSKSDNIVTIHDLIHDLAQSLSKDKVFCHVSKRRPETMEVLVPHDAHHVLLQSLNEDRLIFRHGSVDEHMCNLRTFVTMSSFTTTITLLQHPKLVKLDGLRKLKLVIHERATESILNGDSGCGSLRDCLKKLKNLRQLDMYIGGMPLSKEIDEICTLYNLRTLNLALPGSNRYIGFPMLYLPHTIENLRNLTRLKVIAVLKLPDSLGCLTKLCKLEIPYAQLECLPESISKLVNLNELNLSYSEVRNFSETTGNLKSLRILNLSHCTNLEELPKSIGNLSTLQVLDLSYCKHLKELPESVGNIEALKCLDLGACDNLENVPRKLVHLTNLMKLDLRGTPTSCYFPTGFGSLTRLQDLPVFRVSPRGLATEHAGIEELKDLVDIHGVLDIENLHNVATQEEAMQAELMNKSSVRKLCLKWGDQSWDDTYEREELQVLEGFRPHTKVEIVCITGWRGRRLALWFGDESFDNLQHISITNLPNCTSLWPLHQLPSLESLHCEKMSQLVCLVPSTNIISQCFPVLKELVVIRCDSSMSVPLQKLTVLEQLYFHECPNAYFCDSTCLPYSLKYLEIGGCPFLKSWCDTHKQSKLAHLRRVRAQHSNGYQIICHGEEPRKDGMARSLSRLKERLLMGRWG